MKPGTAKRKGAETEEKFVQFLKGIGVPGAERRHLAGMNDKGDIAGWPNVCVEVKSGAQLNVGEWLRQLDIEIINSEAKIGFVAVRPKGKPDPKDWWMIMRSEELMELLREAGYI